MTPSQIKAKELVDKYVKILTGANADNWTEPAKQIALSEVDDIIEILDEISIGESGTTKIDFGQSFYQEIKSEIPLVY